MRKWGCSTQLQVCLTADQPPVTKQGIQGKREPPHPRLGSRREGQTHSCRGGGAGKAVGKAKGAHRWRQSSGWEMRRPRFQSRLQHRLAEGPWAIMCPPCAACPEEGLGDRRGM